MARLLYPSWHLSTERVLNRGSTWVTSFLILGGREYFLARAVLVLFFARSLPRSPSPSVLDNEAEYWCLGVGDGALWTGLSKRTKRQCWNSISFGLVNWIWSSVLGRRSRRWGGGGIKGRENFPFPLPLAIIRSYIFDHFRRIIFRLGAAWQVQGTVSSGIPPRYSVTLFWYEMMWRRQLVLYTSRFLAFFSCDIVNPDCALGYWSCPIIIIISIISCLYVLYGP